MAERSQTEIAGDQEVDDDDDTAVQSQVQHNVSWLSAVYTTQFHAVSYKSRSLVVSYFLSLQSSVCLLATARI